MLALGSPCLSPRAAPDPLCFRLLLWEMGMLMATHSLGCVGTKPEQVCGEWLSPFPTRFFDPKVSLAPSIVPNGCQHHCFKTLIL